MLSALSTRRMAHPYKPGNANLLALITSVILTAIVHVDDLRFAQFTPPSTPHTLFTLIQLLILSLILFHYNFAIFRRLTEHPSISTSHNTDIHSYAVSLAWSIGGSLAIALGFSTLSAWVANGLFPSLGIPIRIDISMIRDGFVALTVILITLLLYNLTRHQQLLLEEERSNSESLQTRYDALEKQIDPHFLFNSLNTLDGLIGYDDQRAHEYLHQLALSYRYIMQQQRQVTLADEMRFTNNFIAMMQLRYGNGFKVSTHIDPQCLSANVVPISVQLLVENALQHNIVSDRHPLTVTIATRTTTAPDGHTLHSLCVSNPLQPKDGPDHGHHGSIGLTNLSERCRLVLRRDISISQTDTTFSVEIPLQFENSHS